MSSVLSIVSIVNIYIDGSTSDSHQVPRVYPLLDAVVKAFDGHRVEDRLTV